MYAQIGTTVFDGLQSFVSFSSEEEAVLVEYALINRKPRLQGAGIGLRALSISLFLHQEFCAVKDEVSKLRAAKDTYEVLPLLWGNGQDRRVVCHHDAICSALANGCAWQCDRRYGIA